MVNWYLGSHRSAGKPRVCAVSYLNTVPLVWGMLHGPQRDLFELSFALPSECADRVASGAADIGIVPVVELLRRPLATLGDCGIACRGPVRSILLITRVHPARIRTLAADSGSRTSVLLARIVLAQRYGAEPVILPMPPNPDQMLAHADAALIIGDPALHLDPETIGGQVLDLGEEWHAMTGLPMVFAVWAGSPSVARPEIAPAFLGSCRYGLSRLDEIIRAESAARGLPEALVRRYLTTHIVFELGERDYAGLDAFLRQARELDIVVPSGVAAP